jgi:hypothetical protein
VSVKVHVLKDCDENSLNEWLPMETIDLGDHILSNDEIA